MKTVTEHIRDHMLQTWSGSHSMPSLAELRRTERSAEFDRLCSNRLVMGAFRYGRLGCKCKAQYDRVACMIRRLNAYNSDRNAEHLCDVANLAMLEFVEGTHNGVHAKDDGEHTKAKE